MLGIIDIGCKNCSTEYNCRLYEYHGHSDCANKVTARNHNNNNHNNDNNMQSKYSTTLDDFEDLPHLFESTNFNDPFMRLDLSGFEQQQ